MSASQTIFQNYLKNQNQKHQPKFSTNPEQSTHKFTNLMEKYSHPMKRTEIDNIIDCTQLPNFDKIEGIKNEGQVQNSVRQIIVKNGVKKNVAAIAGFFNKTINCENISVLKDQALDVVLYSKVLCNLNKKIEIQTGQHDRYFQHIENKKLNISKTDILLKQIHLQKQKTAKKQDSLLELKLYEFLHHLLEEDEMFQGQTLKDKVSMIALNVDIFRGKEIDGYSKVNLLKVFLAEFKMVQLTKMEKHRQSKQQIPTKQKKSTKTLNQQKKECKKDLKDSRHTVKSTKSLKLAKSMVQDDEWIIRD